MSQFFFREFFFQKLNSIFFEKLYLFFSRNYILFFRKIIKKNTIRMNLNSGEQNLTLRTRNFTENLHNLFFPVTIQYSRISTRPPRRKIFQAPNVPKAIKGQNAKIRGNPWRIRFGAAAAVSKDECRASTIRYSFSC